MDNGNDNPTNERREERARAAGSDPRESGEPGGGQGRRDEVGGSGVYPASGPPAPDDAELRTQAAWGQGDRGAAGYEDSGQSELYFTEEEIRAAEQGRTEGPDGQAGRQERGNAEEER